MYLLWRRDWWLAKRDLRPQARADVVLGANAYAERQATIFGGLATKFATRWKATAAKCGLLAQWPVSIDRGIEQLNMPPAASIHAPTPSSTPLGPLPMPPVSTAVAPPSLDATSSSNPSLDPDGNLTPLSRNPTSQDDEIDQGDIGVVDNTVHIEEDDEEDDAEISDVETDVDDVVGYLGPEGYDSD